MTSPDPGRQQSCESGVVCEKARRPSGRSSRATSGTVMSGSWNVIAPWSQKTRSKVASPNGASPALACTSGKSTPASWSSRAACSSWRAELSMPTGRAPWRARRIDHWAAPQPYSSTSSPATSPRMSSSLSGICHIPQRGSARPSISRCQLWYSSESASQRSRLIAPSADVIAEPEGHLALGGLGRVRAVYEIVRHREREVAADRARRGGGRVGAAHRRAYDRDRTLALEDERERG